MNNNSKYIFESNDSMKNVDVIYRDIEIEDVNNDDMNYSKIEIDDVNNDDVNYSKIEIEDVNNDYMNYSKIENIDMKNDDTNYSKIENENMKNDNMSYNKIDNKNINNDDIENDDMRYDETSGLDVRIIRAVKEMGFENMTPIQKQAIPVFMEGKDIIGQAQTGTGKTAAFGIPVLQMVDPNIKKLQALILCPTRELAIQAAEEIRKFGKYIEGVKVLPIYGGQDITKQIRSLKGGIQIIVGTPGRVMDHMRRHTIKLAQLKMIVLDEADEMLNMGFREDIETILEDIPGDHQTGLFSATMPKPILDITKKYQKEDAVIVKVAAKELTVPNINQYYYEVKLKNKDEVTARLLDYYNPKRSLIFCNTKKKVDELAEALKGRGYFAEGFHGDMSQAQRDKIMNGFRKGFVDILIATDVAARGIDVDDVEAVINYDIPQDIEYYVHRIGRTGRAGKKGRSFTLVVGREIYKVRDIERVCKTKIKPRMVPSAGEINNNKAENVLKEAVSLIQDEKLYSMIKVIENKLDEEDFNAIELAAALLKMQVGEEVEEMKLDFSWFDSDEYKNRKKRSDRRDGRGRDGRGRDGRDRDGRESRNGKDGRSRDGRDRRGRDSRSGRDGNGRDGNGRDSRNDRDSRGRGFRRSERNGDSFKKNSRDNYKNNKCEEKKPRHYHPPKASRRERDAFGRWQGKETE